MISLISWIEFRSFLTMNKIIVQLYPSRKQGGIIDEVAQNWIDTQDHSSYSISEKKQCLICIDKVEYVINKNA